MRKIDRLSAPGVLVFLGQPAVFDSIEEAERAAQAWVQEGDLKYATIIENVIGDVDRTVMERAIVIVNRGVAEVTTEEAIKEGYLDVSPEVGD